MRWLRQGLTLLLAVGAVAAGGLFSLQNTEKIPLDLIVVQLPAQPVAIWILAATKGSSFSYSPTPHEYSKDRPTDHMVSGKR